MSQSNTILAYLIYAKAHLALYVGGKSLEEQNIFTYSLVKRKKKKSTALEDNFLINIFPSQINKLLNT